MQSILFAREDGHMTHGFKDPWSQFEYTGKIEDYLSYKRQVSGFRFQDSGEERIIAVPDTGADSAARLNPKS